MLRKHKFGSALLCSWVVGGAIACGTDAKETKFVPVTPPSSNADGGGVNLGSGGSGANSGPYNNSVQYTDFGKNAVSDTRTNYAAPLGAAVAFGATPVSTVTASAPLCVFEPEANVRYPRNWVAPRIGFSVADAESNVVEVRVKAGNQTNDSIYVSALTVQAGKGSWLMSDDVWELLRTHSFDKSLSFTVRTAYLPANGMSLSKVSAPFVIETGILPVAADGSIVYFSSSMGTLNGISVGTENAPPSPVVSFGVLRGEEVKQRPGQANCVGCHTETPDVNFVMTSTKSPDGVSDGKDWYSSAIARINANDGNTFGAVPTEFSISPLATAEMARGVGGTATSKGAWEPGKRLVLGWFGAKGNTNWPASRTLRTVNLESGTVADVPTGSGRRGAMPVWSSDAQTILYTAIDEVTDGRLGAEGYLPGVQRPTLAADIYQLPYNAGSGGTAAGVPGASSPTVQEFYPALSPDDALLAFNSAPYENGGAPDVMYNPHATVQILKRSGTTSQPLEANKAVSCPTGVVNSDNQSNRWPKWAPAFKTGPKGEKVYFVVFSSARRSPHAQLYVSPVVVAADGTMTSFGALYMRAQDPNTSNHTPVWSRANVGSNPTINVNVQ